LAPSNTSTDEIINAHILNLLQNTLYSLESADKLNKSNPNDIAEVTSAEFLNTANVPGCVVMFIRNVNFDSGIVDGRKGIVRSISSRIVDVQIIAD
ncbi:unnamed protein product, partial [Scytosiphon promiscuus]